MSLLTTAPHRPPNRKERRRMAAQVRQPARPTCACCHPPEPRDGDMAAGASLRLT